MLEAAQSARTNATRMALSTAERDELLKLRKRVKQLEIERDILSKSSGWPRAMARTRFTLNCAMSRLRPMIRAGRGWVKTASQN